MQHPFSSYSETAMCKHMQYFSELIQRQLLAKSCSLSSMIKVQIPHLDVKKKLGHVSKTIFPGIGISIIKIRQS